MHLDRLRCDLMIEKMPYSRELWDRNIWTLYPLKMFIKEAIK